MRTIHILGILVLLALAVPAAPAHAGGVVTVCDEAHLVTALAGGGTVSFACSGTITLTNTIVISTDTTIDGSGQSVTLSGNNTVRVIMVNKGAMLSLNTRSPSQTAVHKPLKSMAAALPTSSEVASRCAFSVTISHRPPTTTPLAGLASAYRRLAHCAGPTS